MSRPDLSLKRPATEPVAEPVAEPEADQYDDSEAPQLMNIGEHGNISYADIYSLEQYLDAAPDKAEALEIIIADISDIIENEESFKGWTSEVYDLIARKQYWYQFSRMWQRLRFLRRGTSSHTSLQHAAQRRTTSSLVGPFLLASGRFFCQGFLAPE